MKTDLPKHAISFAIGLGLGVAALAVAEDWNSPALTSTYTSVITDLKARDVSNARMDYSAATNLPTGVIRFNSSNSHFESWNGTTWTDIQPTVTAHLANTSNPHSTTAAQVGAPTTATLTAHTSNTSNPHSVTAAQTGALAKSSNLSDLTNTTTARSNLGAASSSTLTSHTSSTSNPHSTTAAQVGALAISSNLSDVANVATARTNLEAAESGANGDITSLAIVESLTGTYGMTINSGIGALTFGPATTANRWKIETTGKITPPLALRPDYTVWPSAFTRRRSLDPSVATATQCAEAWNTLVEDLVAQGELR